MFQIESGIPASWWLRVQNTCPTEVFPVLPSLLGQQEPEIVLGKGSGADSIAYWLTRIGLTASPEQILELTAIVKERSMEKKGLLARDEFEQVTRSYLAC